MMLSVTPSRLKGAVSAVCHDIELRVQNTVSTECDEAALWRELSCCILSSQVPYALAQSAADEIHLTGILASAFNRSAEEVQSQLLRTLSGRFAVGLSHRRYRFPMSRSRQLALSWKAIHGQGGLSNLLAKTRDIQEARRWLVVHAPGLGPKQASMFLRNSGITYKLAILDRHVLRYMDFIGLGALGISRTSNLGAYRTHELLLQTHADEVGYPVGLLDWAIWIVMRVAGSGALGRRSP
jgi:N-glycosylase/DNA lyase